MRQKPKRSWAWDLGVISTMGLLTGLFDGGFSSKGFAMMALAGCFAGYLVLFDDPKDRRHGAATRMAVGLVFAASECLVLEAPPRWWAVGALVGMMLGYYGERWARDF